ncbi:endo-1,4-beta-xylanase [Sphingomonas sp. Y38-1Y]|uniref:endo-1,4-beta-xylanase n=1 Tax=Sphingomonas sp. Y38-1Y TaxID=3078265 RepID=UPI0039647910
MDHQDMRTSRRGALMLGGAAMLAATPALARPPASGLDAIARTRGLRFGSAVASGAPGADRGSWANPRYAALLQRDCGLLVAENEMKWQALRPAPDRFDFARADAMMAYAKAKGMTMRGHNLLWHQPKWFPKWLNDHDFGARPAAEAERILTTHIRTVMRRYGAAIPSWDVVNEAVKPEDSTLYDTSLSRALGGAEATLDLAFRTARAEGPKTELVYNDYMSWEPGNERHRAGVLKLLEGFRKRNVPVDALGVQSHLITQSPDIKGTVSRQQAEWRRFLDEVTGMGYRLLITELDVRDNGLPAADGPRDRAVADYTRAYLDVTLSYRQLRDVLAWGMCDRYSWIEGFEPRPDKALRRPTLYDREFRAKPMHAAVAAALAAAPKR